MFEDLYVMHCVHFCWSREDSACDYALKLASLTSASLVSFVGTLNQVAATINAEPIVEYKGGVFTDEQYSQETNHIISIVGWGTDEDTNTEYWIIRNSWYVHIDTKESKLLLGVRRNVSHPVTVFALSRSRGQYWGEMGYMRLATGKNLLGIEGEVAWATPGSFTVHNFPCAEDGKNCAAKSEAGFYEPVSSHQYVDPSEDVVSVQRRLNEDRERERKQRQLRRA
jgi:Papain family cysteine protease